MGMEEDLLVGLGGPSDVTRIRLATSKNRPIENTQRRESAPEQLKAAKEVHLSGHPGRVVR